MIFIWDNFNYNMIFVIELETKILCCRLKILEYNASMNFDNYESYCL